MSPGYRALVALYILISSACFAIDDKCKADMTAIGSAHRVASRLTRQLKKVDDARHQTLVDFIDGLQFVDYATAAPELLKIFLGHKDLEQASFPGAYDKYFFRIGNWLRIGRRQSALENYRQAREEIRTQRRALPEHIVTDTHIALFANGLKRPARQGVYREKPKTSRLGELSDAQVNLLEKNPYLDLVQGTDGTYSLLHSPVKTISKEALRRIRPGNKELVAEIEALQKDFRNGTEVEVRPGLHGELVQALVEERVRWLNNQVKKLGKLSTQHKKSQYIDLVSRFVADVSAIDPFASGSPRVAKTLLDGLLANAKMPVPIVGDMEGSYRVDADTWAEYVREGMLATRAVQEHIAARLAAEVPLGGSIELLTPLVPRHLWVTKKVEGKPQATDPKRRVREADLEQFATYMHTRFRTEPDLKSRFKTEPGEVAAELYQGYRAFVEPRTVDYTKVRHNPGKEFLELPLIPESYTTAVVTTVAGDTAAWKEKIATHFKDQITWRGRAYKTGVLSDEEILDTFRVPTHHGVSIKLNHHRGGTRSLIQAVPGEHGRFNEAVINGQLPYWATQHSTTGSQYKESFGISTSPKFEVAKGFGMGAMFEGVDYGKQMDPEFQKTLTDRLAIGTYQSKYGVPLFRLKQMEPDFSYEYFRQSEVMETGAIAPDATMVVHRFNSQGEVIVTFARNPKKPTQVWVVEGQFDPMRNRAPGKTRLLRTVDLTE